MSESRVIHALYHTMYRLMIARDVERLGELLDDSFVLVHMTGRRQGKEEFLRCVADGTLAYYDEVEKSVVSHVDADGTRATLTGKSLVEASPFGMGRSTWRLQQDIDFVRRDGCWLMVEARASSY
jgi:alpha-glucuronidase